MKKLLVLLVVFAIVGSASADTRWFSHWDGSGTNDLWSNGGNWHNGQYPFPSGLDDVMLYPNGGTGGLCQMDMVASIVSIGFPSVGTTELEIISGGDLTWTTQSWPTFGTVAGRTHILTLNGGSLNVTAGPWLAFGNAGTGILNMESGTLTTSNLRIDWDIATGSGQAYVSGGTIDLSGVLRIGFNGIMDVTGGQIITRGKDDTTTLKGYVTSGHITGITQDDIYYDGTDTYIVPEPTTVALLGLGGLLFRRRK